MRTRKTKSEQSYKRKLRAKAWGWRLLALVVVAFASTMSYAVRPPGAHGARVQRLSPELSKLSSAKNFPTLANQRVQVIVQFKQSPTQRHIQKMTNLGGRHLQKLQAVRGRVYNLPLSALAKLANDPDVAYISPNRPVSGANDFTEATVGADVAQSYGWNGAGTGVAIIDSGISDHPDLHDPSTSLSRVVYSQSFVPGTDASDGYGHGTHVAGIIAGNGSQSNGTFFGVAPKVNLVNLKVLDSTGSGQDSYVIAAIQTAISLKDKYNIRVINLSLGRRVYESFTQD